MATDFDILRVPTLGLQVELCRWRYMTAWHVRRLCSPVWRFYWNPMPGACIEWQGGTVALAPDRLVLIAPDTPFRAEHEGDFEHFFVHFWLGADYRLRAPGVYMATPSAEDLAALRHLAARARQNLPSAGAADGLLLHQAIARALGRIPAEHWHSPVHDPRIRHALSLLTANLRRPLTNDALGQAVGLHPKSFARLFTQEVGVSPQRFALRLRLDRACEQLLNEDVSVDTVAETWGFADRSHLTRAMAKHRATTPGRLRRRTW